MIQAESFQRSRRFAEEALALMTRHEVPFLPNNYEVWYSFVTGRHPDLTRGIEALIRNKVKFTAERNDEIYRNFFGDDNVREIAFEATGKLQGVLGELGDSLGEFSRNNADYSARMLEVDGALSTCDFSEDLRTIVGTILRDTQDTLEKSKEVATQLETSSQEIATLKRDLERTKVEACTDTLTELPNRKHFEERLVHHASTAREEGTPLCLLIADIDFFREFNDAYGHRIGDEVLRLVGRCFKENVKGKDLPARYGGEEFCVLLPDTRLDNAAILAQRIGAALSSREIKNKATGESFGKVTLSFGVACYRAGEALGELVQRADEALYGAKAAGRNTVVAENQHQRASAATA